MWDNFYLGVMAFVGKQKRTQTDYPIEQRIQAVTAMYAIGRDHPLSAAALDAARVILGADVGTSTLARWKDMYSDRVLAVAGDLKPLSIDIESVINDTRTKIVNNYSEFLSIASERIKQPEVINTASLRDLMVSQGIAVEKLILLTDISPELSAVMKDYARTCTLLRLDAIALLQDFIGTLQTEYSPQHTAAAIDVHAAAR